MIKAFSAVLAAAACIALPATAAPAKMSSAQLDQVVAGWANLTPVLNCGHLRGTCGNNGWGNGPDSTNPGSGTMEDPKGATTISKATNGAETDGTNKNTNPVAHSTGR